MIGTDIPSHFRRVAAGGQIRSAFEPGPKNPRDPRRLRFLALTVLILGLLAVACSEPTGHQPPPVVHGWILLNADPDAIDRSLAAASRYGVTQLQLSHDLVMNADELLGDDPEAQARRRRIADLAERADALGMDTFIWAHELSQTSILVCYGEDDPLWQARAQAYRQVFAAVPALDGIVLMFGSADMPPWFTVCTCDWCRDVYPAADPLEAPPNPERIRLITERLGQVIVNELGRGLVARTFVHEPAENDWHAEGFAAVTGVAFTGMHKSEVQDWQPYNPPSPSLGQEGDHPALIELDVAGEYYGLSELPFCAPAYFLWRLEYGLARRGVGTAVRIERGAHSALGTPNEVNLLAIARRLGDRRGSTDRIWDEFVTERYGLKADHPDQKTLIGILADTFPIRLKSHYVLGIWALNKNSDLPTSTALDQFADRGEMPKFDPDWQAIWDALDRPDQQVVIRVYQEAQEAVELAADAKARFAGIAPSLDPTQAADLERRLAHQFRAAEAWRAIKLFIWAERARAQTADPAELQAWMAWAHEDLVRIQQAMAAEGLADVSLASPADIQVFLDNTRALLAPGHPASQPNPFLFSPLRTESLSQGDGGFAFQINQTAQVTVRWGLEIPDFGQELDLGTVLPGETTAFAIEGLPSSKRVVLQLVATTAEGSFESGYHWVFTPGA